MNNYQKFMKWRKDNVPRGAVYEWNFGDNGTLVVEVREGKKRYLVTVYRMRGNGFVKVQQNQYRLLLDALRRGNEIVEAF